MTHVESTDVLVIGSGFGGAITAYHLAAGGAKVVDPGARAVAGSAGVRPRLQARLLLHPGRSTSSSATA